MQNSTNKKDIVMELHMRLLDFYYNRVALIICAEIFYIDNIALELQASGDISAI